MLVTFGESDLLQRTCIASLGKMKEVVVKCLTLFLSPWDNSYSIRAKVRAGWSANMGSSCYPHQEAISSSGKDPWCDMGCRVFPAHR